MDRQELHATAALRSAAGKSRFAPGARVTAENVRDFHAAPETIKTAVRAIRDLGFTVTATGPLGISFSGPRELVKRVFGGRAEDDRPEADRLAPGADLPVPEALRPYVERITLATEVKYWQGA